MGVVAGALHRQGELLAHLDIEGLRGLRQRGGLGVQQRDRVTGAPDVLGRPAEPGGVDLQEDVEGVVGGAADGERVLVDGVCAAAEGTQGRFVKCRLGADVPLVLQLRLGGVIRLQRLHNLVGEGQFAALVERVFIFILFSGVDHHAGGRGRRRDDQMHRGADAGDAGGDGGVGVQVGHPALEPQVRLVVPIGGQLDGGSIVAAAAVRREAHAVLAAVPLIGEIAHRFLVGNVGGEGDRVGVALVDGDDVFAAGVGDVRAAVAALQLHLGLGGEGAEGHCESGLPLADGVAGHGGIRVEDPQTVIHGDRLAGVLSRLPGGPQLRPQESIQFGVQRTVGGEGAAGHDLMAVEQLIGEIADDGVVLTPGVDSQVQRHIAGFVRHVLQCHPGPLHQTGGGGVGFRRVQPDQGEDVAGARLAGGRGDVVGFGVRDHAGLGVEPQEQDVRAAAARGGVHTGVGVHDVVGLHGEEAAVAVEVIAAVGAVRVAGVMGHGLVAGDGAAHGHPRAGGCVPVLQLHTGAVGQAAAPRRHVQHGGEGPGVALVLFKAVHGGAGAQGGSQGLRHGDLHQVAGLGGVAAHDGVQGQVGEIAGLRRDLVDDAVGGLRGGGIAAAGHLHIAVVGIRHDPPELDVHGADGLPGGVGVGIPHAHGTGDDGPGVGAVAVLGEGAGADGVAGDHGAGVLVSGQVDLIILVVGLEHLAGTRVGDLVGHGHGAVHVVGQRRGGDRVDVQAFIHILPVDGGLRRVAADDLRGADALIAAHPHRGHRYESGGGGVVQGRLVGVGDIEVVVPDSGVLGGELVEHGLGQGQPDGGGAGDGLQAADGGGLGGVGDRGIGIVPLVGQLADAAIDIDVGAQGVDHGFIRGGAVLRLIADVHRAGIAPDVRRLGVGQGVDDHRAGGAGGGAVHRAVGVADEHRLGHARELPGSGRIGDGDVEGGGGRVGVAGGIIVFIQANAVPDKEAVRPGGAVLVDHVKFAVPAVVLNVAQVGLQGPHQDAVPVDVPPHLLVIACRCGGGAFDIGGEIVVITFVGRGGLVAGVALLLAVVGLAEHHVGVGRDAAVRGRYRLIRRAIPQPVGVGEVFRDSRYGAGLRQGGGGGGFYRRGGGAVLPGVGDAEADLHFLRRQAAREFGFATDVLGLEGGGAPQHQVAAGDVHGGQVKGPARCSAGGGVHRTAAGHAHGLPGAAVVVLPFKNIVRCSGVLLGQLQRHVDQLHVVGQGRLRVRRRPDLGLRCGTEGHGGRLLVGSGVHGAVAGEGGEHRAEDRGAVGAGQLEIAPPGVVAVKEALGEEDVQVGAVERDCKVAVQQRAAADGIPVRRLIEGDSCYFIQIGAGE